MRYKLTATFDEDVTSRDLSRVERAANKSGALRRAEEGTDGRLVLLDEFNSINEAETFLNDLRPAFEKVGVPFPTVAIEAV